MDPHILNEVDCRLICAYCRKDISRRSWISEWVGEIHYKVTRCECGKVISVKAGHQGSGHDNWDKVVHDWVYTDDVKQGIETIFNDDSLYSMKIRREKAELEKKLK
jgi:hypothetical protein